ncbi:SDR family NAD(P)-dependent oxidoreductase [Rhizobium mongolense]|uniref:SDR family NAD(P)-dependent oxidoreductase n=1 Tax=Rhizobium mongolense TaxID=57676 RepID=UPI0034A389B7
MNFGLDGKVAMVVAGSSGLGLATAEELANEGCPVSNCGRNPLRLERAMDRLRSKGADGRRASDVTDCADAAPWVHETAENSPRIDTLVTNCGGLADLRRSRAARILMLVSEAIVRT